MYASQSSITKLTLKNPSKVNLLVNRSLKIESLPSAAKTHCRLVKSGAADDTYTWNNVLTAYSRWSRLGDAQKLFDEIPCRDTVSWNALIACHVSGRSHSRAWEIFKDMVGMGLPFDGYTLGSVLKSVASTGRVEMGCQLHSLVVKTGFDRNVFAGSALVDMYAKGDRIREAYLVFMLMPERNVVCWNAVITGHAWAGEFSIAFGFLREMEREDTRPDEATFASILTLIDGVQCYRLMCQLHAKIIKNARVMDAIVYNAVIMAYSQCGSIADSVKVFEDMDDIRDLVTWNSMLAAYACRGLSGDANKLFSQMRCLGIAQDMYTFTSVLSVCFEHGEHGQGKALHGLAVKRGLDSAVPVSNALISMYIKDSDSYAMEDAMKCFNLMEYRDNVSWNSVLTGLSQNLCSEEALKFFVHMQSVCPRIDHYAFSAVLRSCSDLAVLKLGQEVHGLVLKSGFSTNDFVTSSLIYMYSKCGVIGDAKRSFNETYRDSSVVWNSIIFGYAQHGQGQTALDLFYEMQELHVEPDHITFVGLLSACSHIGRVEEGFKILKSMESHYGIPLRMEHYACGVDLFGRAGQLDKAKELIDSMPFEPDAMVWMTLLGACRNHGAIELASHVARNLLVLEPREHCTYVLLSNMYAGFGMWDDRAMIQRAMRDKGVGKVAGWSWIEVNNKVHSFNAEDRSHPQAEEIYGSLRKLMEGIEVTDDEFVMTEFFM